MLLHDLQYALRLIRKTPVASAIAVLTIAIGVGANTAIFSVIHAVLLTPLPYAHADRLVQLNESWPSLPGPRPTSRLNYLDWVAQSDVFERIAAVSWGDATLGGADHPVWVDGSLVSPSYFDVFDLHAELGRTFAEGDDQPGHDHVVVLSHRLWVSKFGGDRRIVRSSIRLDGELYTVIGVMPDGMQLHFYDTPMWRPLARASAAPRAGRDLQTVEAKLKPGVTVAQARAQMNTIAGRLAHQYPDANKGYGVIVQPFPRPIGLDVEASLYLLFSAVAVVLAIACVNLANLAMVRGAARAREVAIRAALGASRAQIVRQFLVEHVVTAIGGGLAGVAVAWMVLRGVMPAIPTTGLAGLREAIPHGTTIAVDREVWLFAMGLSALSGIGFGLSPAISAARRPLVETIRAGTSGISAGASSTHMRQVLVVAQVALAFVLLTGAGLLIQSFFTLTQRIDAGFDRRNVLTATLPMPASRFETAAALNLYFDQIGARIKSLPGVRDVAFADATPPMGFPSGKLIQIVGQPAVPFASRLRCGFKVVSASYFRTVGLRLIEGRTLTDDDREGAPFVAVINETMARESFKEEDPIGHQMLLRRTPLHPSGSVPDDAFTIVGVVADEGVSPFERVAQPSVYATREQHPRRNLNLVVRALVPADTLEEPIRRSVAAVDRDQAVADVKTIDQLEAEDVAPDRLRSILLFAFAAVAVALTALGLYGVIAHSIVLRTREIGIRAALGADAWRLLRLVLGQGLTMIALGLVIGVAASLATLRVLRTFLFGVGPADATTLAAVAGIMAVVALLACWLPARQATHVDPLIALKNE
ncbi:MAG TPA: ABC transporter permease [Vicinamibacterales bacterium]|nr:ABC transporter permease [Vicinamibacterales bacterium]